MSDKHDDIDILDVLDHILSASLRELRRIRSKQPTTASPNDTPSQSSLRKSQTNLCIDILKSAGRPLHISAIIESLSLLNIAASRESLVSAISKKLAPHGPFVRTAKNTFGLAGRDTPWSPSDAD
jgi:hypothetical protein